MSEAIIEWELLGILVSIIGGFTALSYQVGRRSKDIDVLTENVKKNAEAQEKHEEECKDDRDKRNEWQAKTDERLAEGSTKMALLNEKYENLHADVREIKEAVTQKR